MRIPLLKAVLEKEKARDYRKEYDQYHGTPEQIKRRAQRNAARRKLGLKRGDGKEADHKNPISNGGSNSKRNLRAVSRDTNRRKGAAVNKADDWEESKHPRADNGQFGSGSGSSPGGKGKESAGAKRKRTAQARRAESSAQTTLGTDAGRKAVQSLISGGGSALDKISWFKQPEKGPEPKPEPEKKPEPAKEPEKKPEATKEPGAGSPADISDIFPRGVSGGIPTKGKVDFTQPYKLVVSGNTYGYKDNLKTEGFSFNSKNKTWEKTVTPPNTPNPYGGTIAENQRNSLNRVIASAGNGKRASQNLSGELVQQSPGTQTPHGESATRPVRPDPSFTDREQERFETFKQTLPGKAMGQNTTFAVAGRNLTHDRKATIMLSNRTNVDQGYRLILRLNNPYAEHMGSEDEYHIDYPAENLNAAIKDYTHVVDHKNLPSENFKVFEREGHTWPGLRRT